MHKSTSESDALGDEAAVLAPSSGEEPASPRRRVDGVEVDATIQYEGAVETLISTGRHRRARLERKGRVRDRLRREDHGRVGRG